MALFEPVGLPAQTAVIAGAMPLARGRRFGPGLVPKALSVTVLRSRPGSRASCRDFMGFAAALRSSLGPTSQMDKGSEGE